MTFATGTTTGFHSFGCKPELFATSTLYDLPSLGPGSMSIFLVGITEANPGDKVFVGCDQDIRNLMITGCVATDNFVAIQAYNATSSAVDIDPATWHIKVVKDR